MNVYQAAMERIDFIFRNFDNIYVSFSGGKDSGVLLNLCLDYMKEHRITRKLGLFHIDYEAQYEMTTKYVDRTIEQNKDLLDVYRICVPFKVPTCTSMMQSYWRPWDESKYNLWVRDLPNDAMVKSDFDFYREDMWDYDFQEQFSLWQHRHKQAGRTACLVGIRTQESLNRWRAIFSDRNKEKFMQKEWTRQVYTNVYNCYPIYDWLTTDIWTANARFMYDYNHLYDLYYQAGVPVEKMRVASPFISAAQDSLKLYRVIEPHTWGKLVSRVNGVNFTSIYGGTTAMGWKSITLPPNHTWESYMYFLLSTLPREVREQYLSKLSVSMNFWKSKGGVLSDDTIRKLRLHGVDIQVGDTTNYHSDKKPVRMSYIDDINISEFREIPTYKRMCVCILKNDHLCKYMGFSLTKLEMKKRTDAINKYKNIL